MTGSVMTAKGTLPGALAVGPQKTGTTWIFAYLASRGDVTLPRGVKELDYFSRRYTRGIDWYARQFPEPRRGDLVAEVSPTYFDPPEVPARVRDALGGVRIVITLRHPAERLHSLWVHMLRYGMTTLPLREAVAEFPELLGSSRYAEHVSRWRETMGETNVAVLFLEDLRANPKAFADRLNRHFGLAPRPIPVELTGKVNEASVPYHSGIARLGWRTASRLRDAGLHGVVEGAKRLGLKDVFFGKPGRGNVPCLAPDDRAWLLERLAPEVDRLERTLAIDLAHWRR